jgi:hypothetical protein
MGETVFALLDADGLVLNVIIADQAYVDELAAQLDDPDVDTGSIEFARAVDITGREPMPGIGWTRAGNGRFVAPEPPEPSQAELDAQAEQDRRAADDAFIADVLERVAAGGALTDTERDRLELVRLARS